jgi:hypothetical protein
MTRAVVDKATLLRQWPDRAPGNGDIVRFWDREYARWTEGTLLGYNTRGNAVIKKTNSDQPCLCSFDLMEVTTPAPDPLWEGLDINATRTPKPAEYSAFQALLEGFMYRGVPASEIIKVLRTRKHEIFLVGGTVRDVIMGGTYNDLDLAGTMPVNDVRRLLQHLFGTSLTCCIVTGHLSLHSSHGEPGIEYSSFQLESRGKRYAWFDHSLLRDYKKRDFTCNAVYYCPFKNVLVDPTLLGIDDAENKVLRPIWGKGDKTLEDLAKISIRFFKFIMRKYSAGDGCKEHLLDHLHKALDRFGERCIDYVRRQVVSKSTGRAEEIVEKLAQSFKEFGKGEEWDKYIHPWHNKILADV